MYNLCVKPTISVLLDSFTDIERDLLVHFRSNTQRTDCVLTSWLLLPYKYDTDSNHLMSY